MPPDRSEAVPAQILPSVREISFLRPFRWLVLGWRDFSRAFMPSLLHGVLAALGGFAILGFAWGHFYLLAGALSGFLLVGPILATGLAVPVIGHASWHAYVDLVDAAGLPLRR